MYECKTYLFVILLSINLNNFEIYLKCINFMWKHFTLFGLKLKIVQKKITSYKNCHNWNEA